MCKRQVTKNHSKISATKEKKAGAGSINFQRKIIIALFFK
jgi:hypothetical protein